MTKISLKELECIFSKWNIPISKLVFIDSDCIPVSEVEIKIKTNYDWNGPIVDFDLDETLNQISNSINPGWFVPCSLDQIMMLAACKGVINVDDYIITRE